MLQLLTDAGVTSESARNRSAKILEYHAVEDVDSFTSIEDLKEIRYRGNSLTIGVISKLWTLKISQRGTVCSICCPVLCCAVVSTQRHPLGCVPPRPRVQPETTRSPRPLTGEHATSCVLCWAAVFSAHRCLCRSIVVSSCAGRCGTPVPSSGRCMHVFGDTTLLNRLVALRAVDRSTYPPFSLCRRPVTVRTTRSRQR